MIEHECEGLGTQSGRHRCRILCPRGTQRLATAAGSCGRYSLSPGPEVEVLDHGSLSAHS